MEIIDSLSLLRFSAGGLQGVNQHHPKKRLSVKEGERELIGKQLHCLQENAFGGVGHIWFIVFSKEF